MKQDKDINLPPTEFKRGRDEVSVEVKPKKGDWRRKPKQEKKKG